MIDYTCSAPVQSESHDATHTFWANFLGFNDATTDKFLIKCDFGSVTLGVLDVVLGSAYNATRHKLDYSVLDDGTTGTLSLVVDFKGLDVNLGYGTLFSVQFQSQGYYGQSDLVLHDFVLYLDGTSGYGYTNDGQIVFT